MSELEQARKLLSALKSAIAIADMAFREWDNDQDHRVGKILRYLGDPDLRGYRRDIDTIHDAVKTAETFLCHWKP
jgi:hypothetical protein